MIERVVAGIVAASVRLSWLTILLGLAVSAGAIYYVVNNFAITTDTSQLISPELDWRKRERQFDAAFSQHTDTIDIVIDGKTPELTESAAAELAAALSKSKPDPFQIVRRRDGGPFFDKNGLLYLSLPEVQDITAGLIKAQPVLGTLSADPTLNGLAKALALVPLGIKEDRAKWIDFEKPLGVMANAMDGMLAGKPTYFSWGQLLTGGAPSPSELRRFLEVKPVLNYSDLEPGAEATVLIRATAKQLGLTPENGVRVRLTGSVPMADEEFGTVAEGAALNTTLTIAAVLVILWLALRSGKIIFAVLVGLFSGLAITAALGLYLVGALNLISVAFAVLFVGIGVDFGIQYAVRYRHERFSRQGLRDSLVAAGRNAGKPLALAAAATTAGFYAFLPTDYVGVSELGLIAGSGMIVAFLTSITLLPALLEVLNPPGELHDVGYRSLQPVDRFMARHRKIILVLTAVGVAAGLPLLAKLEFDFNPINLRSQKVESVSTFNDLMRDPNTAPNTIEILTPNLADAKALATKLDRLPEVDRTVTLASFVPDHQDEKLALIRDCYDLIGPTIEPDEVADAPTDADTRQTLLDTAKDFEDVSKLPGASPLAAHMASTLRKLADATPDVRAKIGAALLDGMKLRLTQIRAALKAEPITLKNLPPEIVADWVTADGHARVEVGPKGDGNDNANLRRFASAVLAVDPNATGVPILIQESAKTVVRAFIQAGLLAFVSITIILFVALRRVTDVLLTLVPLLLAGVVTLELCVLLKLPLNFANIIALPVLLGVGVAFKIYYVLAWRAGETSLLASPLTRAVMFSAMTTAVAFGSLFFSSHPGTSSMGELLALSLVTTLAAAVLFQPILMGPPRTVASPQDNKIPEAVEP
ncbi:MMPL family transporter [Hyphomicrobium sp. MC1]|uniref:hopanoid transporter HpnN n=1 Tax=Hyphomicrobium sp. (strain MC1) TaxID=717785 RepID=UPI000213DB47|nr:MMPL family transporter [Hyphomicrobium sp. MC1]CCB66976.1 putative membrane protein with sterol sensing domain [Hyphomicrobium sp. MC1]